MERDPFAYMPQLLRWPHFDTRTEFTSKTLQIGAWNNVAVAVFPSKIKQSFKVSKEFLVASPHGGWSYSAP